MSNNDNIRSTNKDLSAPAIVGNWAFQVLGILWGAATLISLVKSGFAIELHELPAKVHASYVWFRDMLFEPIALLLRYYGLALGWWLKDLIVAYGLIAGAFWRSYDAYSSRDFYHRDIAQKAVGAVLWPLFLIVLRAHKRRMQRYRDDPDFLAKIVGSGRFEKLPIRLKITREQAAGALAAQVRGFWSTIQNLVLILFFSIAFFVWNQLQNDFGPKSSPAPLSQPSE